MPNQREEICDPTHLQSLLGAYRLFALAVSGANPSAPAFDFSIPVKLIDGQTIEVTGDSPEVWASGTLETYVGVPERFREYWRQMAAVPMSGGCVYDFGRPSSAPVNSNETILNGPTDGGWVWNGGDNWFRSVNVSRSVGYSHDEEHVPPESSGSVHPIDNASKEPAWSGVWPTGYYWTTLPQLVDALSLLEITTPNVVTRMYNRTMSAGEYSAQSAISCQASWNGSEWIALYSEGASLNHSLGQSAYAFLEIHNSGTTPKLVSVSVSVEAPQEWDMAWAYNGEIMDSSAMSRVVTVPALSTYWAVVELESSGGVQDSDYAQTTVHFPDLPFAPGPPPSQIWDAMPYSLPTLPGAPGPMRINLKVDGVVLTAEGAFAA